MLLLPRAVLVEDSYRNHYAEDKYVRGLRSSGWHTAGSTNSWHLDTNCPCVLYGKPPRIVVSVLEAGIGASRRQFRTGLHHSTAEGQASGSLRGELAGKDSNDGPKGTSTGIKPGDSIG